METKAEKGPRENRENRVSVKTGAPMRCDVCVCMYQLTEALCRSRYHTGKQRDKGNRNRMVREPLQDVGTPTLFEPGDLGDNLGVI